MNANTIKNMQQNYLGKVCSIISTSMNRSFDERISREHFVVRVGEITVDGIWGTHPYNEEMVSFYAMDHIISIHQEVELDPSNPEHLEMIKEYEKKTGQKLKPDVGKVYKQKENSELLPILDSAPIPEVQEVTEGDATFIDIENLERLAENSRRAFDAYEKHDLRKH